MVNSMSRTCCGIDSSLIDDVLEKAEEEKENIGKKRESQKGESIKNLKSEIEEPKKNEI